MRKALKQDLSSIIDWDKADQKIQNGVSNLRPKNEFIESLKLICSKKFHVKLPIYVISTNKHGILRVDLEKDRMIKDLEDNDEFNISTQLESEDMMTLFQKLVFISHNLPEIKSRM